MEKKLNLIYKIAKELNKENITWALGASMLLYFKGIVNSCNDIDLLIQIDDIKKAKMIFDNMGDLLPASTNENFKTKVFLQYVMDEIKVDVMAGFAIVKDEITYDCSLYKEQITDTYLLKEELIYLHDLSLWKKYYALMNRDAKVKLIEEAQAEVLYPISYIAEDMIRASNKNHHDINHFLKVHSFARMIGKSENLNSQTQYILEASALVHDIACPFCRQKYGNANGKLQEKESESLLRSFFENKLPEPILERIIYIVCHHHTYTNIKGLDYQILVEADFLVNAQEENLDTDTIFSIEKNIFKTKTGIRLLHSLFNVKEPV